VLPEIDLGPLSLKTFGLMFALGFLAAGAVAARHLREMGKPADWSYEAIFGALVGGLVGARGYYLLQNLDEIRGNPLAAVFSGSGLIWYGGALGGALGVLLWGRLRHVPIRQVMDLAAVPLALGYAIGRAGCQLAGDGDYGVPSSLPWAMPYPDGTVPTTVPVHPTPVYESLAMGLLAWGIWRARHRLAPGAMFGVYLVGAGLERFLVEFIRRNTEVALGLTAAQLESLVLMACGVVVLALVRRPHGLLRPPGEAAAPAPPARARPAARV
jgi:phosphatidylglycerol:prolipoprotein diacylglycerol transferase